MHPVFNAILAIFNVLGGLFQSAVKTLRSAVNIFDQKIDSTKTCCHSASVFECAVRKSLSTQMDGGCDSTTALLLLKSYISTYTHARTYAYRGRIGRRSKCSSAVAAHRGRWLAPRLVRYGKPSALHLGGAA